MSEQQHEALDCPLAHSSSVHPQQGRSPKTRRRNRRIWAHLFWVVSLVFGAVRCCPQAACECVSALAAGGQDSTRLPSRPPPCPARRRRPLALSPFLLTPPHAHLSLFSFSPSSYLTPALPTPPHHNHSAQPCTGAAAPSPASPARTRRLLLHHHDPRSFAPYFSTTTSRQRARRREIEVAISSISSCHD